MPAKECEMACRGNLALCKLNLKQYDQVLDHCEQVLEFDPKNVKACFRMAQAQFALSQERNSASMVKSAHEFAKKAIQLTPNDATCKKFYEEVKLKYEEVIAADKSRDANGPNVIGEEKKSTKDKLLSRVKIDEDEKLPPLGQTLPEEETKQASKPQLHQS